MSLSRWVVALTDMRILRCSGLAFFTCVVLSAACSGRLTVLSGTADGGIGDGDPSGGTGAGAGSGGASGGTGGSGDTGGSTGSGGVTSGSGGSTTTTGSGGSETTGSGGSGPGGTGGASGSGGSTTTTGSGGSETTGSGGSGPGGSGGISGSGGAGAAGAAGSAGSGGGIITNDSGSCGCVTGHIDWGMDGGHVTYHDTSALEVCNLFVHQRTAVAPGPPVLFCEQQITNCVGAFGPGDVSRAIAHADVRAAIAAAPVLYGEDTRPADGQVLRIQIGTAIVEVGNPCNKDGCKPIPAGVDALANLLRSVTKQELARSPCSTTFPPPAN